MQRVFRIEVLNNKYLTISCVDVNCPGRVHGHLSKYDVTWVVSVFEPHTCEISSTLSDHLNLTSTLIARLFLYDEIVRTKDVVARNIQLSMERHGEQSRRLWRSGLGHFMMHMIMLSIKLPQENP